MKLFHFLSYRASEMVFSKVVQQCPDLLRRSSWRTDPVGNDPQLATYGRANRLGLLGDDLRLEAADRLESAAQNAVDASFFEVKDMLRLIIAITLGQHEHGIADPGLAIPRRPDPVALAPVDRALRDERRRQHFRDREYFTAANGAR